MSACERCWQEASRRAGLLGGSVAERYQEVLVEQDEYPTCPNYFLVEEGGEA